MILTFDIAVKNAIGLSKAEFEYVITKQKLKLQIKIDIIN